MSTPTTSRYVGDPHNPTAFPPLATRLLNIRLSPLDSFSRRDVSSKVLAGTEIIPGSEWD